MPTRAFSTPIIRTAILTVTALLGAAPVGPRRDAACAQEPPSARAEAFEVGAARVGELPKGKEADGIIGDFVLRNARIEALVGGNLPGRKANMGTNWRAPTPGCLYDLAVRGSDNDQLTCLSPGNLEGQLSSVRLLRDGGDGAAVVRAERTAAIGKGLEEVHDYVLEPDAEHLVIVSTWTNHGDAPVKLSPAPVVKGLANVVAIGDISVGDAQNPRDRQGYAWMPIALRDGSATDLAPRDLAPGASVTRTLAVAPGASPAEAYGALLALGGGVGTLEASLRDPQGAPAPGATIEIPFAKKTLLAHASAAGGVTAALPPAAYTVRIVDVGRPALERTVIIEAGKTTRLDATLGAAGTVRFVVRNGAPDGPLLPAKAQLIGDGDTRDPVLGVPIQAHGCNNQYHSERGEFVVLAPAGSYRAVVTRGIEHSHHEERIRVVAGEEVVVQAVLHRVVDTTGWVSTDYHNHSTPSGDNYTGTDDRISNLAAEHIEFAPATEHNRIYDWGPHIARLGLAGEIATVVGIELTGPNAHFNAFPLAPTPYVQDNGAPVWVEDPRVNAIALREFGGGGPDRWVQINHPSVGRFFRDRDGDGIADGGYAGLEDLIDAAEVWSTEILSPLPRTEYLLSSGQKATRENRTFAWLQLLNQGRRMWCVAVSDAHSVFGNGVGGWRTYVPSSTDDPAKIDHREIVRNSKAGRMVMTNGPFLLASLEDGTLPGGATRAAGAIGVRVRVTATTWIDIDRVQILVNGRMPEALRFTPASHPQLFERRTPSTRFEATIPVTLSEDAHIIVAAVGDAYDLRIGYGNSWQSGMRPCAFTNPMYVDIDGDGFRPNGDTLGHPLPVEFRNP